MDSHAGAWEPEIRELAKVLLYNPSSTGGRKFPYHPKVKEIRFFQKIGFLSGLDISALLH